MRNANYDVAAIAPAWTSNATTEWDANDADQAGTTSDPKLVVEHSSPAAFNAKPFFLIF